MDYKHWLIDLEIRCLVCIAVGCGLAAGGLHFGAAWRRGVASRPGSRTSEGDAAVIGFPGNLFLYARLQSFPSGAYTIEGGGWAVPGAISKEKINR